MINSFTFYNNYYELLDNLPSEDDKKTMLVAIVDYMFKGIEPQLEGLNKAIWVNIKMPLDKSKKNIKNGLKGGRPKTKKDDEIKSEVETQKKAKENPKESERKTKAKANNISTFLFLISNFIFNNINNNIYLSNSIKEWLEYKEEKKEKYTEIGLKKLLNEIEKNVDKYGAEKVIEIINLSMANNWKGIIFDKLKTDEKKPEWFDKKIQNDNLTDDEKKEFDELLKEFK